MATFVPKVEDQQGNTAQFLGYSQPLSQETISGSFSKASAINIAGIGDTLSNVTKGADNTIKAVIDEAINKGVDTQREGFTGALEQIAGIPQANRVADSQPNTPLTLSPQTSNVPQAVDAGINRISNLANASGSGKLSSTYYTGRLDLLAKDLRAQYPGYRDYIDQKIAQETGGNPANQYMQQLLTQINQGLTNNMSEKEKDLTFIRSQFDKPGAAAIYQARSEGRISGADVVLWASKSQSVEEKAKQAKANFDVKNYSYQDGNLTAKQTVNDLGDDIINNGFVTLGTALGGQKGGINFSDVGPTLNKLASGEVKLSEDDANKLAYSFSVFRDNMYAELRQKAIASGATRYMQPSEIDEQINAKLKPVDRIIEHITNKEYGLAYQDSNFIRSTTDEVAKSLMTSKDDVVRTYARSSAAIQRIGGPNAGVRILQDRIADGLPEHLRTVIGIGKLDIASQSAGVPTTLSQYIDTLHKAGIGVDSNPNNPTPGKRTERGVYDALTNLPSTVTSGDVPDSIKINIFNGSYGPGNENLIGKFSKDQFDRNGNLIPGQNYVFSKMTTPAITDEAWRLGRSNPQVWQNYRNWAEGTHGQLFGQDIRDLNVLTTNSGIHLRYDPNTNKIGYFTDENFNRQSGMTVNGKFIQTGPTDTLPLRILQQVKQKVSAINSSLGSMTSIAKKEGMDVNTYFLNLLQSQNLSPETLGLGPNGNGKDIPSNIQEPTLNEFKKSEYQDLEGERQQYAYNYFISKGYTPEQTAGILGGLSGETANLNTTQVHDNGIGYGIAAWNKERLVALREFAKSKDMPVSDLRTQLEFINHELKGSENATHVALQGVQSPEEAARIYTNMFERPNPRLANTGTRMRNARKYYDQFTRG